MYNNQIDEIKAIPPETWEAHGLLQQAKNSGYVCPSCGNGQGSDGDGIKFSLENGAYITHCFRGCGCDGSIIDVVMHKFNMPLNDAIKFLKNLLNMPVRNTFAQIQAPKQDKKNPPRDLVKNRIEIAQKLLPDFMNQQPNGLYRGLPLEQYQKFGCGMTANKYRDPEGFKPIFEDGRERFIVPTEGLDQYLSRCISEPNYKYGKVHVCAEGAYIKIFGGKIAKKLAKQKNLPIFVVEGEFDAMSIDFAGFPAIAIVGSDISEMQLNDFSIFPKGTKFIVMLDKDWLDKRGDKNWAPEKVQTKLIKLGYDVALNFLHDAKDANALLCTGNDHLKNQLLQIVADCDGNYKSLAQIPQEILCEDNKVFSAMKMPNAPINLQIPYGYTFDEFGISDERGFITEPILITKILVSDGYENQRVELAVYDSLKKYWHTHILPRTDIFSPKTLLLLANYGMFITQSKKGRAGKIADFLDALIRLNYRQGKIPVVKVHNLPGWKDSDCKKYIYPSDEGVDYVLDGPIDYKTAFATKGDKIAWLQMYHKTLLESPMARYICGSALIAPLLKLFHERNLIINFDAPSESGKTSVLHMALSIFGNPDDLKNNFHTTANALETICHAFNDLPCWFDEYQSANQYVRDAISQLIYILSDGKGKGRLNKDSQLKQMAKYNTVVITSAEQNLLPSGAGAGAVNRLLNISLGRVASDDFANEVRNFSLKNYGHFGKNWIDYIINHKDELQKTYDERLSFYKKFEGNSSAHLRAIAFIHTALIHFTKMLGLELDIKKFCDDDFIKLENVLPKNERANAVRAINAIQDYIFIKQNGFAKFYFNEATQKWEFMNAKGDQVGVILRNGDFAINHTMLRKYLEQDCNFPSAEAIIRELFNNKKIDSTEKTGSHRFQKAININGFAQWFYVFKKEAFEEPETPEIPDIPEPEKPEVPEQTFEPEIELKSASDFENKIVSSEDFETDETPPPKIYIASNDEPDEVDEVEDDNFEWWNPKSFPTLAAFEKYQRDKYCRENNCYWDDDLKDFVQLE